MPAALVATVIVAIVNWYSRWHRNDRLELITKPLTTIGAIAIAALADGPRGATIFAGGKLGDLMAQRVRRLGLVDRLWNFVARRSLDDLTATKFNSAR